MTVLNQAEEIEEFFESLADNIVDDSSGHESDPRTNIFQRENPTWLRTNKGLML